ncbi:DMT family transporter [Aquimarina sp. MMG015]|uniref:DMT family transporter n=1 Tax=Aquimarina TaxID=290174 RepID=UPI000429AAA9|nr:MULTISPECIES: DMT family transporter [Aquimarina]AXT54957.1 DMT family transporter [Aquimarina sp. AD1]MBQ4801906.1 DMT family transporter [Aquimarina sp. MMG015]RKN07535.1 DMT family transporter [Aquimarina sp. AD1]
MQKSKQISLGIILAIIGVVLFSAKAVMVKMAYKYQVTSEHLLLFRMSFSLPVYIIIAQFNKPSSLEKIKKKDYLWIVFFGFIGYYLASYFDFLGLQYIKAGLERIILFVYPTLVLVISRIFLKHKITKQQLVAILITYIGVLITFWQELQLDTPNLLSGVSLIFLSALTYAIYLVGSGWLIPKFGVVVFTSYAMIISSLCIISQYLIFDRSDILSYSLEVYVLSVLMAFFSTIIPSYLISWAIARLGASNVAIIGSLGPVSTILLAFFILEESLSVLQIIGAGIVIFGIYITTRKK